MSFAEETSTKRKLTGDKRKKWVAGVVCLVAVALSVLSLVRQMPHSSSGAILSSSYGRGGGGRGGPQMPGTRGQITTVSADAITIQGRDGSAKTFALTAATKITVDQKPVAAADLKAGQRARVVSTDAKNATEVHIRTRPPGGRGGGSGGGSGLQLVAAPSVNAAFLVAAKSRRRRNQAVCQQVGN